MSDEREAPNEREDHEHEPQGRPEYRREIPFSTEARTDEMAAGLIHEPGTGGDPPMFRYDPGTGAVVKMDEPTLGPLYEISEHALDEIVAALGNLSTPFCDDALRARGYIIAVRENGPILLPRAPEFAEVNEEAAADLEEPPAVALARLQHQLAIATQQRDLLSRQVDSLVQRLAGLHVAHGTMDMAAAQGFVQKEILPINQVLQQIAASQQETGQ